MVLYVSPGYYKEDSEQHNAKKAKYEIDSKLPSEAFRDSITDSPLALRDNAFFPSFRFNVKASTQQKRNREIMYHVPYLPIWHGQRLTRMTQARPMLLARRLSTTRALAAIKTDHLLEPGYLRVQGCKVAVPY